MKNMLKYKIQTEYIKINIKEIYMKNIRKHKYKQNT